MRPASARTEELSFAVALLIVLTFSSNARAQNSQSGAQNASQAPCDAAAATTAQNGSTNQSNSGLSTDAKNLENSVKQLGSIFKKKPAASSTAAAPSPCPAPASNASANGPAPAAGAPAANSTPAAASSPSPAPQAPASGSAFGGVQLPPAPPGGLDPSKLPDILGVHIGTPTDKALAQLNALYPLARDNVGHQLSGSQGNGYVKYKTTNDPPFVSSTSNFRPFPEGCSPRGCQSSDQISAIFSGPPERVLVRLDRSLGYDGDRVPTSDTLKSALIQKYGPNFTEYPPLTFNWAFDEQGKALPPPNKPVSCQGILSQQGFPGYSSLPGGPSTPRNPQILESYLGIPPASPQQIQKQQLVTIMRNRCPFILVRAQIISSQMTITIQELPEDLRDAFAAEAYLRQGANAQENQQLKNAQQQAAPKF